VYGARHIHAKDCTRGKLFFKQEAETVRVHYVQGDPLPCPALIRALRTLDVKDDERIAHLLHFGHLRKHECLHLPDVCLRELLTDIIHWPAYIATGTTSLGVAGPTR
jgi:hypothetical protein